MNPTLTDLKALARQAGEILLSGFGGRHQIDYKGAIDLVTEVDHQSEAFLLGEIQRRFPEHTIVTEESGEQSGQDCYVWYIDPLDGTVNFAHGVPIFCISLAYAENGQMKLAAVYQPALDECFCAECGHGATLNDQPIQVSNSRVLDRSLLTTGFAYDIRTNPRNNLEQHNRLSLISQGVRRLGSAAMDLCYVAAGRFDGYWELSVKPWDIAAGGLIAEEAGARVSNVYGDPHYMQTPHSILATNPNIYAEMLQVLNQG